MRTIFFSIILFLSSLGCLAQKKGAPTKPSNEQDQKYTPPPSSIFNIKADKSSGQLGTVKTVLGFDITLISRGVLAVSAERQIGKSPISLNGGLGFVFTKDLMQVLMTSSQTFEAYSNLHNTAYSFGDILKYSTFSPNHRFFGTLGLRIYPSYSGDLDGTYFEMGVRWHNYETKLTNAGSNFGPYPIQVPTPIINQIKTTTFSIKYGYQFSSGGGRFYSNWYIGFGVRKVQFEGIKETEISRYSPETGSRTYNELAPNGNTVMGYMPVLLFGWQIAIGM